jgi:hypothetical protein
LERRETPALIGSPVYTSGQVIFNFDAQPDYVEVAGTYDPWFGGSTTVSWYQGIGPVSHTVYFTPWLWGGDPTIVLNMGSGGGDWVWIQGNANAVTVNGQGGLDTVDIGDGNVGVQDVHNTVTVMNPPAGGYTALTINDQADPNPRTATLIASSLTGLAPAPINFVQGDLRSLTINGGSGGNTFTVANTPYSSYLGPPSFQTTLNSGSGADTVNVQRTTGPLVVNTGGGDDTILVGGPANGLGGIQGALRVNGGTGNDSLTLSDAPVAGSIWYTLTATRMVMRSGAVPTTYGWDTETITVQAGSGDATFVVSGTAPGHTLTVNGGSGNNTLYGPSQAQADWWITGSDSGGLGNSPVLGSPVAFTAVQNLNGGDGSDTFRFFFSGGISGNLNGGGGPGPNALDYTWYDGNVIVNLQTNTATGVGGSIANIRNVTGSSVPTPGSYNILVGNGGNVLIGGNGRRNLLIAGASASPSWLFGGDDEDILIGGTTAWDTNTAALMAIMDEWTRTDIGYDERVDHVMRGGGLTTFLLDPDPPTPTVTGNGVTDFLFGGGPALDLYFHDSGDFLPPLDPGERDVFV